MAHKQVVQRCVNYLKLIRWPRRVAWSPRAQSNAAWTALWSLHSTVLPHLGWKGACWCYILSECVVLARNPGETRGTCSAVESQKKESPCPKSFATSADGMLRWCVGKKQKENTVKETTGCLPLWFSAGDLQQPQNWFKDSRPVGTCWRNCWEWAFDVKV